MNRSHQDCPRSLEDALLFHEQALSASESLDFQEHLDACPACQEVIRDQQRLDRDLIELPVGKLTSSRIDSMIAQAIEPSPKSHRRPGILRLVKWNAIAAAAAFLLWIAWPYFWSSTPVGSSGDERIAIDDTPPSPEHGEVDESPAAEDHPDLIDHIAESDDSQTLPPNDPPIDLDLSVDEDIVSSMRSKRFERLETARTFLAETMTLAPEDALEEGARLFSSPDQWFRGLGAIVTEEDRSQAERSIALLAEATRMTEFALYRRVALTALHEAFSTPSLTDAVILSTRRLEPRDRVDLLRRAADDLSNNVPALVELATLGNKESVPTLRRWCLKWLRSGEETDIASLRRVLGELRPSCPQALAMTLSLYKEGAPRELLTSSLGRLDERGRAQVIDSLESGFPVSRADALVLARLSPHPSYVDALMEQVEVAREPASVLEVMVAIDDITPFEAHAELVHERRLSHWRQTMVLESYQTLLTSRGTEWIASHAPEMTDQAREFMIDQGRKLDSPRAFELMFALARNRELPSLDRATALMSAPMEASDFGREDLLAWIEDEKQDAIESRGSREVLSSLLVTMYQQEGRTGLREALDRLDVAPRSRSELSRLARRVALQTSSREDSENREFLAAPVKALADRLIFDVDKER